MALKKPTHMPESVAPQNGGRSLSCKPANTSGQKKVRQIDWYLIHNGKIF